MFVVALRHLLVGSMRTESNIEIKFKLNMILIISSLNLSHMMLIYAILQVNGFKNRFTWFLVGLADFLI